MNRREPNLTADRMEDWPLWRLLILLDDVEREFGASCSTARVVSRVIRDRLESGRRPAQRTQAQTRREGTHA